MANFGCITLGQTVVVLSPEHAEIVANTGWSKAEVQAFLFEHAKRSVEDMKRIGKHRPESHELQNRPDIHRGLRAEDILVTVGGGDAGGHSAFIPSWSRGRGSIMQSRPITGGSPVADS